MRFTGKERDAETGLDYFGARYMSAAQGRFTSPDAPFADQHPDDPQSWNLYAYVRNNPMNGVDPDGQAVCFSTPCPPEILYVFRTGPIDYKDPKNRPSPQLPGEVIDDRNPELRPWHQPKPVEIVLFPEKPSWVDPLSSEIPRLDSVLPFGLRIGRTQPKLPPRTIVSEDGVVIYRNPPGPREHGPAHLHVDGGGKSTKIGQNGRPIEGQPELSPRQRLVVEGNKGLIRTAVDKIMRYFDYNRRQ